MFRHKSSSGFARWSSSLLRLCSVIKSSTTPTAGRGVERGDEDLRHVWHLHALPSDSSIATFILLHSDSSHTEHSTPRERPVIYNRRHSNCKHIHASSVTLAAIGCGLLNITRHDFRYRWHAGMISSGAGCLQRCSW